MYIYRDHLYGELFVTEQKEKQMKLWNLFLMA